MWRMASCATVTFAHLAKIHQNLFDSSQIISKQFQRWSRRILLCKWYRYSYSKTTKSISTDFIYWFGYSSWKWRWECICLLETCIYGVISSTSTGILSRKRQCQWMRTWEWKRLLYKFSVQITYSRRIIHQIFLQVSECLHKRTNFWLRG